MAAREPPPRTTGEGLGGLIESLFWRVGGGGDSFVLLSAVVFFVLMIMYTDSTGDDGG